MLARRSPPALAFVAAALLVLADSGSVPLSAQDDGGRPAGFALPKVEYPETEYEWDLAIQGDVITYTFPVKNTGNAVLRILRVQSNCGCTTPEFTKEIAPGEEGFVTLQVNTGEVSAGYLRKTGTVYTNDPSATDQILWMRGQVDPVLVPGTPTLELAGVIDQTKEMRFVFTPGTDQKTTVLAARFEHSLAEVVSLTPREGGGAEVVVRAGASEKPELLRDYLMLKVRLEGQEPFEPKFPVMIRHLDTVKITPGGNVVFYRRQTAHLERDPNRDVSKEIQIRAQDPDGTIEVKGVKIVDAPEGVFSVELRTVVPGKHAIVKVRVLKTCAESMVQGKLVIEVDDEKRPTRELQVMAQFRMRPPGG